MTSAKKRILVVDDEPLLRTVLAELLTEAGFAVDQAPSSVEALKMVVDPDNYDLLITDLNMPEVDGMAVARTARRHNPRIPVLFVSGRADLLANLPKTPQPCESLQKPFRASQFQAAVQHLVEGASH